MKIFGERRNNDILMFMECIFFCFYYIRLVYILDGWYNIFSTSTYFTYIKYQETGYKGWQKANLLWVGGVFFYYKNIFFMNSTYQYAITFNIKWLHSIYLVRYFISILAIFNGIFYCLLFFDIYLEILSYDYWIYFL